MNINIGMSQDSICIQGLSKKYRLFNTPFDRIKEALLPFGKRYSQDFWALQDIDFIVRKGETVGIIGQNGSGKSTLLQILASVLLPTEGVVRTDGRVSALLELGAGFDPEITGRSNVLFYGAMMGLHEREMRERMRDIEDFAGIGEFIDRPIKTYSSGMFARLAFAAAVNVDPDIFLIDEALAVGDARFQRKCFAKFAELKSSGKTLIFVSHDIEAIAKHCDRVLFLEKGKLIAQGSPLDITSFYREVMYTGQPPDMETLTGNTSELKTESGNVITLAGSYEEFLSVRPDGERFHLHPMYNPNEHVFGGGHAHIEDFFFSVEDEIEPSLIESGSKSDLCVRVRLGRKIETLMWGVALRSKDGVTIFGTNSIIDPEAFDKIEVESGFVFKISQSLCLSGGDYFFDVGIVEIIDGKEHVLHFRGNAIHFTVADTPGFDGLVDLRVLR